MMIRIISIIFFLMLIFPLAGGYGYYKRNKGKVLYINQEKIRNPRYFAISFSQMIETKWKDYAGDNRLYLSREEKVIEADKEVCFPNPCEAIVIGEKKEFRPPAGIEFYKEVYSMETAILEGPLRIRAIAGKKNLQIGSNVEIVRWADAIQEVTIKDNCDLGICISSLKEIKIGMNCKFRRLYAPKIYLGYSRQDPKIRQEKRNKIQLNSRDLMKNIKSNVKYVDDFMTNKKGVADFSVVTEEELIVLENIILNGHLRSHKTIRICDDSIVAGNIFAEKDIKIGRNVQVLGNVFSQGDIIIEEGSVIGEENNISSVIARGSIRFEKDCMIYGYVSNEQGGTIASASFSTLWNRD